MFWAALAGALAAAAARGRGALTPARDPGWESRSRAEARAEGILAGPARRTRAGWRSSFEFASPSGPQRALLWLPRGADPADFVPGRGAAVVGRLTPPRRPRDPGDDDEEARASAAGQAWVLRARVVALSSAAVAARWRPAGAAQAARLSAESAFARRLSPEDAALLSALVLGDSGGLKTTLSRAVRDSGGTHLLVVSGLKVGFVAGAAAALALTLGLRPLPRALAALGAGGFYALMAGGDPPSVRAWLMLAAAAAARAFDRPTTPSAGLALAAAILLAVSPAAALSTGALMSFGGTAAVLAVARRLDASAPRSWPRWARAARTLAGINLAIAVALLPLFAAAFGRASLIGPLANLALVPLAAGLMGGGAALWACDALAPRAAPWIARACGAGLAAFEAACRRAAALPWSTVELRPWRPHEVGAYGCLLAACLLWPRARAASAAAALGAALLAAHALLFPPPPIAVAFLSREPGAALVRFSGGPALFVGPRPPDAGARRAALALGAVPIERVLVGRIVDLRLGRIVLRVGDPRGPSARRGEGPFAIIGRPRAGALEADSDGDSLLVETLVPAGLRVGARVPQ